MWFQIWYTFEIFNCKNQFKKCYHFNKLLHLCIPQTFFIWLKTDIELGVNSQQNQYKGKAINSNKMLKRGTNSLPKSSHISKKMQKAITTTNFSSSPEITRPMPLYHEDIRLISIRDITANNIHQSAP